MTTDDFYKKYISCAQEVEKRYGVPAMSCLAQSAIETGWGGSVPGNMMFGIKATPSWTGKVQNLWTSEVANGVVKRVQAKFRAYDSPIDSFLDYGRFLKENARYKNAFHYSDPYLFSKEVADAGYATDPTYYRKITSVIDILKKKAQIIR